jgi:hypothetical protein
MPKRFALQRFGNQEFLLVFAHNNNRLNPFFMLKCSYGFPDTAGSANNQTGFADRSRSHIPERSPITLKCMEISLLTGWQIR